MWQALAAILPISVAVAVSSVPIMATILILLSPKRGVSAVPFLIGWVLGLTVVVAAAAVAAVAVPSSGTRQTSILGGVLLIVIGAALMTLSIIQLRRSIRREPTDDLPRLLRGVDAFGRWPAFGLAFALNLRPKALLLAIAAGLSMHADKLGLAQSAIVIAVYVVISASTVAVPIVITLVSPDAATARLVAARAWLTRNSATVTTVIMLMIGVFIVGNGLSRL